MKATVLTLAALAIGTSAQDPDLPGCELDAAAMGVNAVDISSLPQCGQTCVNNMISIGPSIGCPAVDNGQPAAACLCSKEDFAYGIRDCSSESCPAGTDLQQVNQYGLDYCQSAQPPAESTTLPAIGVFSSAANTAGAGTGSTPSPSAPAASPTTASQTGSAVTTIPVISTETSGGSTFETTLGSTTLYAGQTVSSANTMSSGAANMSSSMTDMMSSAANMTSTPVTTVPVVSTMTSDGSTQETTVGSSTRFSAAPASSSSSKAAGVTVRPVPGFAGGAGWTEQVAGGLAAAVGAVVLFGI